jgi:hypothetical protein
VKQAGAEGNGKLAEKNLTGLSRSQQPYLAVRHRAKFNQVRVGIAWSDGLFRLWDVESGDLKDEARDGQAGWNNTAAHLPGTEEWLTGGFDGKAGYLRNWREGEKLALEPGTARPVPDTDYAALVPRALALLPAAAGGGDRAAALFLAVHAKKLERKFYQLRILSLPGLRTHGTIDLWDLAASDPILATSPDGGGLPWPAPGETGIGSMTSKTCWRTARSP